MSTIILSSILSKAGSIFGPIGQIVGSELGALLGSQLDNAIFGLDAEQKITHGAEAEKSASSNLNLWQSNSNYLWHCSHCWKHYLVTANKEEAITTQN
ncbi:hypothetical protein [Wolbachia endosymbiont of Erebia cassioides]|uniref:hypothetical protein n=1 Tax=Wolbachia endosymbiont of Erebia cassioides TaxID=2803379 RepID=UPI001FE2AEB9|nr:hypothetical protein [Wolbachia endosymbiont of Erebia cassioides]